MDRPIDTPQVPEETQPTPDTTLHGWLLTAARVAWVAVALLAVGLFIAGLPFAYDESVTVCIEVVCDQERLLPEDAEALRDLGLSERFYAVFFSGFVSVFALSFTLVGGLIFWRRSDDWMAMLVSLALVSFGTSWTDVANSLVTANPEWRFAPTFVLTVGLTTLLLLFYLFPDGRFVPRWTRFVASVWIAVSVAVFVDSALAQELYGEGLGAPLEGLVLLLVGSVAVIGVYAQVYRYTRYSTPVQRQQSKWVMAGLTTAVLLTTVGISLNETVLSSPGLPRLMGNLLGVPLLQAIPVMVVPGAIGVSIMRYRLWDIDVLFNRTLVYGAITLALAVAFLGSAGLFQLVFWAVTGEQSPVALAGSALVMGVLFLPVRQRVRHLLDRRFYPDAAQSNDLSVIRTMVIPSSPAFFQGGRYKAIDFLGEGATKRVYSVRDKTRDTEVALALIKVEGMDESGSRRMQQEARTMQELGGHPNIVPLYEFGEDRGQPYMVMPIMVGGTLEHLLRSSGNRLPLADTLDIAADICRGLGFAHSNGVIHRDIKPGNIWLGDDREAKIGDFGIALSHGATRLTRAGTVVGTPDYMSPEQFESDTVDERSDLYSAGATVYEMVSGIRPFLGDSPMAVIYGHINTPPVPPTVHNPDCPKDLEDLVLALLAKGPSDRPESASGVLSSLERIRNAVGHE